MSIKVDTDGLSKGLWQLIKDNGDTACVAYGMLPAKLMELANRLLKEKIPDKYLDRDTLETIDGKALRVTILHNVSCKILEYAKNEGVLIV